MRLYKELLLLFVLSNLCALTPRLALSEEAAVVHNQAATQLIDEAWKVCVQASRALRTDLEESSLVFNQYSELYQSAVELDATIAENPNRAIAKKIRFCTQVASRIQSARAEPVIMQAVKHCDESRKALGIGRIKSATRSFQQYKQAKAQALQTVSVDQLVATLRGKLNRCNKLAKELNIAQGNREVYLNSYGLVSDQLNGALKQCESVTSKAVSNVTQLGVEGLKQRQEAIKKIITSQVAEGKTAKKWIQSIRSQYPIGHRRLSKQRKNIDTCLTQLGNKIRLEEQKLALSGESTVYQETAAVLLQDIDQTLTRCVLDRELINGADDTGRLLSLEEHWKSADKITQLGQRVEKLQAVNSDEENEFGLPESYDMLNICIADLLEDIQTQHERIYTQQLELTPSVNDGVSEPTLEELIRDITPPSTSTEDASLEEISAEDASTESS